MKNRPLVYLACPYSHPDIRVKKARFKAANKATAHLIADGLMIFSPITHSHPIHMMGDLPGDWAFWGRYDEAFLSCCHKVIVLMLDGWEKSKGIQAEIQIAKRMNIPITYMNP